MMQMVLRRCLSVSAIVALSIAASCSNGSDRTIRIVRKADSFALKFHIRALEGLCYAPQSIMFNGHLSLDGFDGVDRWVLERAEQDRETSDQSQADGLMGPR